MAASIIKTYKEHLPALRFVGKCYTDADRGQDGGFGHKWDEWFQKGWFMPLDELDQLEEMENGYIGLMGCSEAEGSFVYWIGMFLPQDAEVPEGYEYIDMPESDIGMNWIHGSQATGEIFGQEVHNMCMVELEQNDMARYRDDFKDDGEKWWWFFERYNCPRFTMPDDEGKVILDYGMYIETA